MYSVIVMAPLAGSLAAGFLGFLLGPSGAALASVLGVVASFSCSVMAFKAVALGGTPVYVDLFPWVVSGPVNIQWGLTFDSLTVVMLRVVTGVSMLVHIYSTGYMGEDPHRARFMSYLSLFTFFMLILVTGSNFLQMFVGWEGVGLCSYLLINFWYTRLQANKAAIKAMLVNRVGDVALMLAMFRIFVQFGTLDYATVFALAPTAIGSSLIFCGMHFDALTMISLLLFMGAVGKSAQLGLHTWLPDAMEGPTPVSALIHAATMVTAGVFLLARTSPILEYAPMAREVITCFGAATAFFAATVGLVQNDMKRVIAYSTCSQLGYMIFACGLSAYSVGVFHLATHAGFKALLFLSAGSVIHAMADEQDMRRMGGLKKVLPLTYTMVVVGSLALTGFPFLSGFYSKDAILEIAWGSFTGVGGMAYLLGLLGACCTAYYSMRLLYRTFLAAPMGYKSAYEGAHDAPPVMAIPLRVLCFAAVFVGYMGRDLLIGVGTPMWNNALFTHPMNLPILEAEYLPSKYKRVATWLSLGATGLAALIYGWSHWSKLSHGVKMSENGRMLYTFLNRKWFFDTVYGLVAQSALHHGYCTTYEAVDRGVIELLGPHGLSNFLGTRVGLSRTLHSGQVYNSALFTVVAFFGIGALGLSSVGYGETLSWVDSKLWLLGALLLALWGSSVKEPVTSWWES